MLFLQVDSNQTDELKRKIDQLQISINNKDQVIDEYKNRLDSLESTVQQLKATVYQLKEKCSPNNSINDQIMTFRWVVSFLKLKECEQFSDPFYTSSAPYLLQMSAVIYDQTLSLWLYRCRGENDENGKIESDFSNFKCNIYLLNGFGEIKAPPFLLDQSFHGLRIGARYDRSVGQGLDVFLKTSDWSRWLIKNNLHFFCKFGPML